MKVHRNIYAFISSGFQSKCHYCCVAGKGWTMAWWERYVKTRKKSDKTTDNKNKGCTIPIYNPFLLLRMPFYRVSNWLQLKGQTKDSSTAHIQAGGTFIECASRQRSDMCMQLYGTSKENTLLYCVTKMVNSRRKAGSSRNGRIRFLGGETRQTVQSWEVLTKRVKKGLWALSFFFESFNLKKSECRAWGWTAECVYGNKCACVGVLMMVVVIGCTRKDRCLDSGSEWIVMRKRSRIKLVAPPPVFVAWVVVVIVVEKKKHHDLDLESEVAETLLVGLDHVEAVFFAQVEDALVTSLLSLGAWAAGLERLAVGTDGACWCSSGGSGGGDDGCGSRGHFL